MSIVLTGATTELGSATLKQLAARGSRAIGLYRTDRPRLESMRDLELVDLRCADLAETDITGILPDRIETLVHVAGNSAAPGVTAADLVRDNVLATATLLDAVRARGARRLILISSMSAYGRITAARVDETTPSVDADAYGQTKRLAETLVAEHVDTGCDVVGVALRLPGVLGPEAHRHFMARVATAARDQAPIRIVNPDAAFNNAAHVDELGELLADLCHRPLVGFQMFPVGAAGMTTVREAVTLVRDAMESTSPIVIEDSSQPSFTIDSTGASTALGYRPSDIRTMLIRYGREFRGER